MTVNPAQSSGAVSRALDMLKRIRRLDGCALIREAKLLHDDCPNGTDTPAFLLAVNRMFHEKPDEDTPLEILLGFETGEVLFLSRYPVILCLFFHKEEDLSSIRTGGNQFLNKFGPLLGAGSPPESKPIKKDDWSQQSFYNAVAMKPAAKKTAPATPEKKPGRLSLEIPKTPKPALPVKQEIPTAEEPETTQWQEFLGELETIYAKVAGRANARRIIEREVEGKTIDPLVLSKRITATIPNRKVRRMIENEIQQYLAEHYD